MQYTKQFVSIDSQLNILKNLGLEIINDAFVRHTLSNISFFKLSGYFFPFIENNSDFSENTTFDNITDLFYFDKELRITLLKMLEKVEISLKTKITNLIGEKYGNFGHLNPENFSSDFKHGEFLKILSSEEIKSKEVFLTEYFSTYSEEEHTPIWISVEILPFGVISRLYQYMLSSDKKKISRDYNLSPIVLESWLHNLNILRNFCAHNSKIINRTFNKPAQIDSWKKLNIHYDRLAGFFMILSYLLKKINPKFDYSEIQKNLYSYFSVYPQQLKYLGVSTIEEINYLF